MFPPTRYSAIVALKSEDPGVRARSYEKVAAAYYKPVYKYLRVSGKRSAEEAGDLTQGFFAAAFEKGYFEKYDAEKALFRTYLRVCLDRWVAKHERDGRRVKRGGKTPVLSLDFEQAEGELAGAGPVAPESIDTYFEREWIRALFTASIDGLRAECEARQKRLYWTVFERYDLAAEPPPKPSYAELAAELGIAVTDVTNYLHAARKSLRRIVLERLREITATEEEFRQEALAVLGTEA